MDINGCIVPMCTPAKSRTGPIDHDALEDFTQFLTEGNVHGLFPLGSTGEFSSLSREERAAVISAVVENSGDLPVLAGCGGTAVSEVREYIADAYQARADYAVVVTPYYLPTNDRSLGAFYRAIAEESPLPILIYHIPDFTGKDLSTNQVARLATHPEIVGVKDTSRDIVRIRQLIENTPDDFAILQGATMMGIAALYLGADGLIPSSANIYPEFLSELYESAQENNWENTLEIQLDVVLPLIDQFSSMPTLSAMKYCVGRVGPELGPPLHPLPQLNGDQKGLLDDVVQRL